LQGQVEETDARDGEVALPEVSPSARGSGRARRARARARARLKRVRAEERAKDSSLPLPVRSRDSIPIRARRASLFSVFRQLRVRTTMFAALLMLEPCSLSLYASARVLIALLDRRLCTHFGSRFPCIGR